MCTLYNVHCIPYGIGGSVALVDRSGNVELRIRYRGTVCFVL